MEKMPRIIADMGELAARAATLVPNAESEFAALDGFRKVTATAKSIKLVSELPKIPAFMTTTLNDLTAQIQQLKATIENLKTKLPDYQAKGKVCSEKKIYTPLECFQFTYPHK